jgi:hypothetical protein
MKTNANAMTTNANAYTYMGPNPSGTARSGLHGPLSMVRGGLIISCRGGRFRANVFGSSALSHCRAAKSDAQANDNHCCKKLLHKVCLLYW